MHCSVMDLFVGSMNEDGIGSPCVVAASVAATSDNALYCKGKCTGKVDISY